MILHIQYVTVITISALLALNLPDPAEPSAELSAERRMSRMGHKEPDVQAASRQYQ
jgi:hypothetical protein